MDQTEQGAPFPGLRNLDHVGLSVPDLEQAIHFFTDAFGAEVLWRIGPLTADPKRFSGTVGQNAQALVAMLRCGPNINLKLLQYNAPDKNQRMPRNYDGGSAHIAFFVDDLDVATRYLETKGVTFLEGPIPTKDGPKRGETIHYGLTPWGSYIELVSRPENLPYEEQTSARLFGPAESWTAP